MKFLQSLLEMGGQDPDWTPTIFFSKEAYQAVERDVRSPHFTQTGEVAGSVRSNYWPKIKQELERRGLKFRADWDKPADAAPVATNSNQKVLWFAHWVRGRVGDVLTRFPNTKKTENPNELTYYVDPNDWERMQRYISQTLRLQYGKDYGLKE